MHATGTTQTATTEEGRLYANACSKCPACARVMAGCTPCATSALPSATARSSRCSAANGAGKTTTLEILEGFRARDGGTAEVLGYAPGERSSARELRERTGLVLQDIAVEPYLTVRETIARAALATTRPRGAWPRSSGWWA